MTDPSDPNSPPPRTTGGNWNWEPPNPADLEAMLPGYTVEKLLGQGGMGAVYKGVQTSLDRPVAIKILPSDIEKEEHDYAERFRNEAKVMARLLHPAIVTVFDFGQTESGQLFFVMEYVDGTDVHQMISSQGKLSAEHALAITAHVCDALTAAHALNIVHRDIKPANVLINQQGQVKVADFGLAKIDEHGDRGLTRTGYSMGTPDYVAPESLALGVNVDGRADIYAVGVMLYQMLTGEVPRGAFKAPSEKVSGLDPRFDPIVVKAMQSDPADRYQNAVELRRDLDVILTVPLAQTEGGPGTSALPQQAVLEVPGQRSAAPKMIVRGNRKSPVGNTAPVKPPTQPTESSGNKVALLAVGLGAAAMIVAGVFYFVNAAKGPKEAAPPQVVATTTPPKPEPAKQPEPKPEPPKETPKAPEPKSVAETRAKPATEPAPAKEPAPAPDPDKVAAVTPGSPNIPPAKPTAPGSESTPPGPSPSTPPEPEPSPSPASGKLPALPDGLPADVAKRLAEIDDQFQAAYERDIAPGHTAAVADLDTNFAAAVQRALDAATQAGRLNEAVQLRGEMDRFAAKGRLPVADLDSVPESLKKLRTTYRAGLVTLERDRISKAKRLYEVHDQLLDAHQKKLTQQKRLEDALLVKARRDELARLRMAEAEAVALVTSEEPPLSSPAEVGSEPAPAQVPAKPFKVPKGATVESAIDWVFSVGGTIDISVAEEKVRGISDNSKLPKEPFEVTSVEISDPKTEVTDESIAILSVLTSLESIRVTGTNVMFSSLAPLTPLKKLKKVTVGLHSKDGIPDAEIRKLSALPLLETIVIQPRDRSGEYCDSLRGLANLRELAFFGGRRLSEKGAEAIATLTQLTSLTFHKLDRVSQRFLEALAEQEIPNCSPSLSIQPPALLDRREGNTSHAFGGLRLLKSRSRRDPVPGLAKPLQ